MSRIQATVNGGSLGRWFEALCRIQYPQIEMLARADGMKLQNKVLPNVGAIYTFWWTGDFDLLTANKVNRNLVLPGPGGREVEFFVDDEWLGVKAGLPIPLYVGKTTAGLRKRIGQHLCLKQERVLPRRGEVPSRRKGYKAERPTSTSQLRAGIDHLFPMENNTRSIVLEHVGLSYVELDGDKHAANRFYLEDLAIGRMRPPFNVDIER